MNNKGVLDYNTVTGGVSAATFDHFIGTSLLPHLQSFNGGIPAA